MKRQVRRRRPLRQRHLRSWQTLGIVIAVAIGLFVLLRPLFSSEDGKLETSGPSPSASTSPSEGYDPDDDLRKQLERFVQYYKAPPSRGRDTVLKGIALNDTVFNKLTTSDDDSSMAASSKEARQTRVLVDTQSPNEFKVAQQGDDYTIVTSTTYLRFLRPNEQPYVIPWSYTTVWLDTSYGWRFIDFLETE